MYLMLAVDSECNKIGNCSGFSVGRCCLVGCLNALLIPASGFASMMPVFTACTMISFMRWHNRFTVSRLPFAAIGLMASIALMAVILWIGTLPSFGKMCSSRDRHESAAWSAETLAFLISIHRDAICSSVLLCAAPCIRFFSSLCSFGSISCASSSLASVRFFRASARFMSGYAPKLRQVRFLVWVSVKSGYCVRKF